MHETLPAERRREVGEGGGGAGRETSHPLHFGQLERDEVSAGRVGHRVREEAGVAGAGGQRDGERQHEHFGEGADLVRGRLRPLEQGEAVRIDGGHPRGEDRVDERLLRAEVVERRGRVALAGRGADLAQRHGGEAARGEEALGDLQQAGSGGVRHRGVPVGSGTLSQSV